MRATFSPSSIGSFFAAVAVLLSGASSLRGVEEIAIRSGPERVSLVELFSSEGCSSCPPAEKWLGALRDDPRLWQGFVPVAFHVDYWDGLGWKDQLAQPSFTARQRAYSSAWGTASIYTPGFVVNGREWRGWVGHGAFPAGVGRAGMLEARTSGESVAVRFEPGAQLAGGFVHAAWLGMGLVSDVRRGENSGRALRHDFVVLTHGEAKLVSRDASGAWTAQIELPKPAQKAGALAVWVEANGAPIQAAGGWLPAATDTKSRR